MVRMLSEGAGDMITQIEIDGFKTFRDFKVELGPFQVIVGPNGSGKSNLFDALELLTRLAEQNLRTAFQGIRGDDDELFTKLSDEQRANKIQIAVEMLVDRKVKDRWGLEKVLDNTRLRYEVTISRSVNDNGLDELHVVHEELRSLPEARDSWCKKYKVVSHTEKWRYFIMMHPLGDAPATWTPDIPEFSGIPMIELDEGIGSNKRVAAEKIEGTVLSGVTDTQYPHAFAAREELRSLRFLHLNPESLRKSSSMKAPAFLAPDGGNLPTTLARMQAEDRFVLSDISRDMVGLVPGILKIEVVKNVASNEYDLWARTTDQRSFPAQGLSDGTLRLLAIATMRNDPQFHGMLCLEEPENGVDALHLKNMMRLLKEMATDVSDPQQLQEPLRQVLITTHSTALISLPEVIDALIFALRVTRVEPQQSTLQVTRMVPMALSSPQGTKEEGHKDVAAEIYTIDQIRKYLENDHLDEALKHLEKARIALVQENV